MIGRMLMGAALFGGSVYIMGEGDTVRAVSAAVAFGVGFVYARLGDGREVTE